MSDTTIETKRARTRRSAKAHWLMAGVTKRQAELHRELAVLLEKEADAHTVLDRWAREGAERNAETGEGDAMARWGKQHMQQVVLARKEAAAHRDLALRSDARTAWHKTIAVLLLKTADSENPPSPDDVGIDDDVLDLDDDIPEAPGGPEIKP